MTNKGYFQKTIKAKDKKGGFMFWNNTSHVALVVSKEEFLMMYQVRITPIYEGLKQEDMLFQLLLGPIDLFLEVQLGMKEKEVEVELWQGEYKQDFNEEADFEIGR